MASDEIKRLRQLMTTGPYATVAEVNALPTGVRAFLIAIRELLPVALDEIDRAVGQEKQSAAALDGFLGDLERAKNAHVPTEIHCPKCGELHVDQDEWATTRLHRKHLCHNCGNVWAPYAVTTVGVDFHVKCREERDALEKRRDELLQQIWNLGQSQPLDEEVANALSRQGALLAEVGTLKAENAELKRRIAELEAAKPREPYVNMATEYDGTDYG